MPSVRLSGVNLAFGACTILDSVNLNISHGQKIALSGANGSGKTTLLRIINGELQPDSGQVIYEKDTKVSYLPQTGSKKLRCSLYEEVEKAFIEESKLQDSLTELEKRMSLEHSDESSELSKLLKQYNTLQERLQESDYFMRREIIKRVLHGLGFNENQYTEPVNQFSEGWQMRITLARVLCERSDILLLDEPTNYLDLEARNWLESFICDFRGGVLVVSHDRYFLDTTVESVAEVYMGKTRIYPGSFSQYEIRRKEELAQIAKAYVQQQDEIERIELFIRRFRYKASKAKQVQSRIKQLDRLERITPPPSMKHIHFNFPSPPHSGRVSLKLSEVLKTYGEQTVFEGVDLELARGEKLVLVGVNGAGKSTLMRIMAGKEKQTRGSVNYGSGSSIGYFSADHLESLTEPGSVIEQVESWVTADLFPHLRNLLGAFLFRGDDIFKPVSVLSGGEKSRLAILKLLCNPVNLLFLDEPTNHLDIVSKDVLLDALKSYKGTLVFVSHDRYFIEKLATRVLEIDKQDTALYYGDYSYYLWRKEQEERETDTDIHFPQSNKVSHLKLNREQEKKRKTWLRRLEREEADIMTEVENLQSAAARLEHSMAEEDVYKDGEKVGRIKRELSENALKQKKLMNRWEELEAEQRNIITE